LDSCHKNKLYHVNNDLKNGESYIDGETRLRSYDRCNKKTINESLMGDPKWTIQGNRQHWGQVIEQRKTTK